MSTTDFTNSSAADVRRKLGLLLLSSGMAELKKCASNLINKSDIDHINNQVKLMHLFFFKFQLKILARGTGGWTPCLHI